MQATGGIRAVHSTRTRTLLIQDASQHATWLAGHASEARKRPVVWAMPTWSHHPPSRPSHHSDAACMHASGRVARLSLSGTSGWLRRAAPLCS